MMFVISRVRTTLVIFFLIPFCVAAQNNSQEGLLWRITGNNLAKPSYLYGTVHISDKRVFNFSDSLYTAFESSQGYAMEVNPDSLMIEFFKDNFDTSEKTLLKDVLAAKDFARIKTKLQERFKKPAGEVTAREFRSYFSDWRSMSDDKDGMQTFMDAYLYNVARRQGKWVGGIEDAADQMSIKDKTPLESYIPELLTDRRESKRFMEEMISLYMADNLEKLSLLVEKGYKLSTDSIMLRRNRKMSYRIDSLAHIRSTFFAIGTAHLPGIEGVVRLLRNRGFSVTPVISSKRLHATDYHFKQVAIPWVPVQSNIGLYTAQMPGEPQKDWGAQENMDMKLYADISTNLFYFTMGVVGKTTGNVDSMMEQVIKNINKRAEITNVQAINKDSIAGKEMTVFADNVTFRVQIFYQSPAMYVAMVGSPVAGAIRCEDTEHFFRSFTMHKSTMPANQSWQQQVYHQFGFTLAFPGKPNMKKSKADDAGTIMNNTFSVSDIKSGGYFQCVVQDVQRGYYLKNDTALFDNYTNRMQNDLGALDMQVRYDAIQQYPAMWADFYLVNNNDTFYNRTLNLHRGNRIYMVVVTIKKEDEHLPLIDSFFQSFSCIPVLESNWSLQQAPDKSFSSWTPEPWWVVPDTTQNKNIKDLDYEAYDAPAPVTFFVSKLPYPPDFWAADDSSLLRSEVENRMEDQDSLLSCKQIHNGPYKGVEALIRMADNHNLKKIRLLLVGDTLVNIYAIAAPEFMDKENSRRFFEDLTITQPHTPVTLFVNKAQQLINALQSKDSAIVANAIATLKKVHFTKEDLPVLHKALLERYHDSIHKYDISWQLFQRVAWLKDESTLQMVDKEYNRLPADKEALRYDLLYLPAYAKTRESFALIKKLLSQHPPTEGMNYQLFLKMTDTPALAATILPDLLPLLNDSLAGGKIVTLAERLLDSNLIDRQALLTFKGALCAKGTAWVKKLQKDREPEGVYDNHALIRLLGKLKDPQADMVLRKFLSQPNEHLAYTAISSLLKNDQPVPAVELSKVAADRYYRLDLYNDLEKLKKLSLFPKQYLTQQALAESELFIYAREENTVNKMTLVGERIVTYKGQKRRFYLYRIDMSEGDEKNIHLGIAGPYSLQTSKIQTYLDETGILWSKEYNASGIDKDLKAYLHEYETAENP
jgi:uncharacterized protein YbaP (TraB family)